MLLWKSVLHSFFTLVVPLWWFLLFNRVAFSFVALHNWEFYSILPLWYYLLFVKNEWDKNNFRDHFSSNVRSELLYVVFELWHVGAVNFMNDLAFKCQQHLGLGCSAFKSRVLQLFNLLSVNQNNVDSFFELVHNCALQVLVAWFKGLAMTGPGGMHVNDE